MGRLPAGEYTVTTLHGEAEHVTLDLGPEVGDQELGLDAQEAGQDEARSRSDRHRHEHGTQEGPEQVGVALPQDVVDQVLRGSRQHEAREAIDQDQA